MSEFRLNRWGGAALLVFGIAIVVIALGWYPG
jgi:hypothetical protein